MTNVAKKSDLSVCEISVSYKNKTKASERKQISNSKDIYEFLEPVFGDMIEHHEEMYAIFMNNQHKILGISKISQGGITETTADPRIIFQIALKANASAIVVSHNHPSGNPYPSSCDDKITQKLVNAGKFLDIQVTDHVIMVDGAYYSYADEGKL